MKGLTCDSLGSEDDDDLPPIHGASEVVSALGVEDDVEDEDEDEEDDEGDDDDAEDANAESDASSSSSDEKEASPNAASSPQVKPLPLESDFIPSCLPQHLSATLVFYAGSIDPTRHCELSRCCQVRRVVPCRDRRRDSGRVGYCESIAASTPQTTTILSQVKLIRYWQFALLCFVSLLLLETIMFQ